MKIIAEVILFAICGALVSVGWCTTIWLVRRQPAWLRTCVGLAGSLVFLLAMGGSCMLACSIFGTLWSAGLCLATYAIVTLAVMWPILARIDGQERRRAQPTKPSNTTSNSALGADSEAVQG